MKILTILSITTLLSINLIAQVDELQINKQIAALEDSVQIKIEQYGEKHEAVVNIYFELFDTLHKYAKYDKALSIAEKCLDICLKILGEKHHMTATSYNNLGKVYYSKGNYSEAMEYWEKALALRLDIYGETDSLAAQSFTNIGILYSVAGEYSKALEYYQKALATHLEIFGEKHPSTAKSFIYLGSLYKSKGDYSKALEYHQKSIEILGEKHSSAAASFGGIGIIYFIKGMYAKSLEYYQKALAIKIKVVGERHPSIANLYNNIGIIYNYTGEYAKSLEFHQKALAMQLKVLGEMHDNMASTYNFLGEVFHSSGDYINALKNFQKGLTIRLEILGEKNIYTASSYGNIGILYSTTGSYIKALEYLNKSVAIDLEILGEKHPYTATSFANIGLIHKKKGDYDKALEYFQKTFAIQSEIFGEKHPLIATVFKSIGLVCFEKGDYSKALEYCQKALAIQLEVLGEKHPDLIATQVILVRAFEALKDVNQADSLWNIIIPKIEDQLSKNYLFLPAGKKILYLKKIEYAFRSFHYFTSENGSEQTKLLAADLLVNTKSQILDYGISTRQLIENINDGNLDSVALQLNSINQKVAKAELLSQDELKQKGWNLDTLRLHQDELASQILAYPKLKDKLNPPKYNWKQIQEKLQADEALIDYFSFYDTKDSTEVFHAMLIKKDEPQPVFIPLTAAKPVDELLEAKDNLPLYIQYKEARQEMYGYVWQALEPHLQDIKTIHLSPVASLNKVDFESLQNEEGQYLAALFDFHYYSSSKDFYKQTESQPDYADATLYGHIAYFEDHQAQYEIEEDTLALRFNRDTLQPLPATLHEVNAIESICTKSNIHPTLLTIDAAKEDTIAYFSGDRAPGIIHFATHGAYLPPLNKAANKMEMASLTGQDRFRAADNPLQRSMLMLSNAGETWQKSGPNIIADNDGILTALEVTNLDLSDTELVVLSACNSGIGSQHTTEGVFGLPRAFKLAGVDKILVSLWPVEDETTKELMIQFYTNLLQNKQDAATALRNAKAEMRNRNAAPKKWAGFVLVE